MIDVTEHGLVCREQARKRVEKEHKFRGDEGQPRSVRHIGGTVTGVLRAGRTGDAIRSRLRGQTIAGPDLLRIEVLAVIRKCLIAGALTTTQADDAVEDLLDLPVSVFPSAPLLRRAWALRDNVTGYDACYVVLAETLDCPLLTADARLARAPGTTCAVELA